MSGRPARRGRCYHGIVREPAASMSTGKGGHGPSSGRASFPRFSDVAHAIQPQHVEEVVDWLTKASSSSVTQGETSVQSTAAVLILPPCPQLLLP